MKARMKAAASVFAWALFLAVPRLPASPFPYHTYDSMVAELEQLAADHPGLAELSTAQDAYGLPAVLDGADPLSHYVLRVTNEASGLDKPEVLLVAGQHGDEAVGPEVVLALSRLLLESYGSSPWLTELVDRREIYLLPLANPAGFRHRVRESPGAEGAEDMNRDHLYDRDDCAFACRDEDSLSTVGARAVHELARRHLFRVVLDYHGGAQLILHPWGTPLHLANAESPDDRALALLGERMSAFAGGFNGFYPVGTSNELYGAVHGPLDDTAYATSWDPPNADPLWPTQGWRALSYTVEISNQKKPTAASLGGDAMLLTPGGAEDGWVPKNVRVGLAAIDAAEPYVVWTNRGEIPGSIAAGDKVTVFWQVRGCFQVDETRVRFGTSSDPATDFSGETPLQQQTTGEPCFEPPTPFAADVVFDAPGTYYLTPVARVDSVLLSQSDPVPPGAPQSWMVRSRTEEGFHFENATDPGEVNAVRGRMYWGAEPLEIRVDDGLIFADGFESGDVGAWTGPVRRALESVGKGSKGSGRATLGRERR